MVSLIIIVFMALMIIIIIIIIIVIIIIIIIIKLHRISLPSSKRTLSQQTYKLVRIVSVIIFHLSKLWKTKFFILCGGVFQVGLQGKFEIDTLIVQTNEYGNTINRSREELKYLYWRHLAGWERGPVEIIKNTLKKCLLAASAAKTENCVQSETIAKCVRQYIGFECRKKTYNINC